MKPELRNNARDAAGFTLVETLMALTLMGIILGALATITGQWMPHWNHGMHRLQRDEMLTLGLDRLTSDLSGAEFVSVDRDTSQPYFEGLERSVTFIRTSLGPNAGSALELVRVVETFNEQGAALVRMRADFAVWRDPGIQSAFTNPVVLVRAPYRITFSYAGADRIWRPTWQRQAGLPTAIKLVVREEGNLNIHSASTAVRLHVAIPQRCIAAKSFDECLRSSPQHANTRS